VPGSALVGARPSARTEEQRPPVRWSDLPGLGELLAWTTRGVAPGRTWVVSPSPADLRARWSRLVAAPLDEKRTLFVADERRDLDAMFDGGLPGQPPARRSLAAERRSAPAPIRYGRRSFDRQWLLPDIRVIDRPNIPLWSVREVPGQVFLSTCPSADLLGGPALVASAVLPQFNHFNGQRGQVWPLWLDRAGTEPNVAEGLLPLLEDEAGRPVGPAELFAYIAALVAHPGYTERFARELRSGVIRVPVTTDAEVLSRAVDVGHEVLRLHTLGEHRAGGRRGRSSALLATDTPIRPRLEAPLTHLAGGRPDTAVYDADDWTITIGDGVVADVSPEVWSYEVGLMPVVVQWLEQRLAPEDRRRQSALDLMTTDAWEVSWTAELLQVLSALTALRGLEEEQDALLGEVLDGPLLSGHGPDRSRRPTRSAS
jgi:hypothetical protein